MRARDLGSFLCYWIFLLVCSCLQIFGITVAVKIVHTYECRCNTSYTPSFPVYHINALVFDACQRFACVAGRDQTTVTEGFSLLKQKREKYPWDKVVACD